jgi:ADP-ribose pyrophosphatase YjhB (NUDIX family)
MNSGYCIYFNEKPIRIIPKEKEGLWNATLRPGIFPVFYSGLETARTVIEKMTDDSVEEIWMTCNNIDECCNDFKSVFQFVIAGGGLVKNEKDEYLFIFRRGKWDLPKGKLDEMESIEECAIREVEEETGLKQVELQGHLCDTHHIYLEKGNYVLKESVWFNMNASSAQELTPQTEEDIHEIVWLAPSHWHTVLHNTYPSVKDVLKQTGQLELT